MKIAIANDHAGCVLKKNIVEYLVEQGHEVIDYGTNTEESVDYPDYAKLVGEAVVSGTADRGILICGTGIGMAMACNKIHGIRAAVCYSEDTARLSRAHNDANVLCVGARTHTPEQAILMIYQWLITPFDGGRHKQRIDKITAIENAT